MVRWFAGLVVVAGGAGCTEEVVPRIVLEIKDNIPPRLNLEVPQANEVVLGARELDLRGVLRDDHDGQVRVEAYVDGKLARESVVQVWDGFLDLHVPLSTTELGLDGPHELNVRVMDEDGASRWLPEPIPFVVLDGIIVQSIEVDGALLASGTYQVEVFAKSDLLDQYLGCVPLPTVELDNQRYNVDAVIEAPLGDIIDTAIRFEVWERDRVEPCPSLPTGRDNWVGTSPPVELGQLAEGRWQGDFGDVRYLEAYIGRR